MISLRETVQFMCVMEIKVNTQKIHTCEKKKNTSKIIMWYYNDWGNIHVSNKNIQTIGWFTIWDNLKLTYDYN